MDKTTEHTSSYFEHIGCRAIFKDSIDLLHDSGRSRYAGRVESAVVTGDQVAMILRRQRLRTFPSVFRAMTGLTVALFDALASDLVPAFHAARCRRLDRPDRRRAIGGGDHFDLDPADQLLLTIAWLRHYPTQEVLGYLFGVSDSTALRAVARWL